MSTGKVAASAAVPGPKLPILVVLGPDVMQVGRGGQLLVIGRPIGLMIGYVLLALNGWWVLAILVFVFGYTALVVAVHDLCHRSLKLSPKANELWLSVLGVMAEISGSAVQATHIVHHRNFSAALAGKMPEGSHVYDDDPETAYGGLNLWRAIAVSPVYHLSLWRWTRQQRTALPPRTMIEALSHFVLGVASVAVLPWTRVPFVYAVGVFICSVLFPIINIRLFHDVESADVLQSTRSVRGPMPWLTMGLSDHLEHHLYPQVSSLKARALAERVKEPLRHVQP